MYIFFFKKNAATCNLKLRERGNLLWNLQLSQSGKTSRLVFYFIREGRSHIVVREVSFPFPNISGSWFWSWLWPTFLCSQKESKKKKNVSLNVWKSSNRQWIRWNYPQVIKRSHQGYRIRELSIKVIISKIPAYKTIVI